MRLVVGMPRILLAVTPARIETDPHRMSGQPEELPGQRANQPSQPPCGPKAPAPSTCKSPTSQLSPAGSAKVFVPATKPFSVVKTFARMRLAESPEYIVRSHTCKDGHRPPSSERAARRAAWPASKTQQGQPPCRPKAPAPSTCQSPTSQESSPGRAEILVPATKPFSLGENGGQNAIGRITRVYR